MEIVELNVARIVALVLVAMPVTTLGSSDVSAGRVGEFAPSFVAGNVEELIVTPCDCFLMIFESGLHEDLLRLRVRRCANIRCFISDILQYICLSYHKS